MNLTGKENITKQPLNLPSTGRRNARRSRPLDSWPTGCVRTWIGCRVLVFLLFASLLQGCEKGVFFRWSPEVTEEISLSPFGEISVNSGFHIELRSDPEFSISLTGPESILENISYEVIDNVLELTDRNSYQWLPDYPVASLSITFPDINSITINSASSVYSPDTLFVTDLSVFAPAQLIELDLTVNSERIFLRTGTDNYGYYTLRGKSDNIDLRLFGSAQVWAEELKAGIAHVRNYSIADCHVSAISELRVWLEYYGNIYYYDSPDEVIIESIGSRGRLIQIDPD